jgi:uncharacterized protein (DUF58 family)
MAAHLRLKINLLPILTAILIIMQWIDPSRVWTILLVGLGSAWLTSYLWARSLARNLSLKREMRFGWAQVGDRLEEHFVIINGSSLPATWVELEDHSTLPEYKINLATGVGGNSYNQWRTEGLCTRRGLYTLGGTTMKTGDPLGIYAVTLDDPTNTYLMVMPPVLHLPAIAVAPGGYIGEGRPRPNAPEYIANAASVREYRSGESLRLIHWPTTARQNKPYIRLFEGAPNGDWWILLDLDRSAQIGEGWDSTEEHGVILAASLADRGLHARQSVGLVVSSEDLVWLPPLQGEGQRLDILRALALVKPGEVPLGEFLECTRPSLGSRSSLVIITARTDANWLQALLPLTWRGIIPTVLMLDPRSFGGQAGAASIAAVLSEMGITRHIIQRDMLNRPEARPGQRGQWGWRYTPTGRAIPIRPSGDLSWRKLSK